MTQNLNLQKRQIRQGNLSDNREVERLLMQYAGIFKRQIKIYAETVVKKHKPVKNLAR